MKNSLFKNSLYNVLYKTLNVLFPLISSTYAAHVLLSDGVGKVAYAQNIAQYFVLLAALGLPNYGTKIIARCRDNFVEVNQHFSELFYINGVSTTFCVLIYYLLIFSVDYFSSNQSLYLVAGLTIVFNYINVDWFYQGEEDYKYIAIRSFMIKLLSLILLLVMVKDVDDCIKYALIYSIAIGGNNLLNVIRLRKYNVKFVFSDIHIAPHMKPVLLLLCTSFSVEVYTLLDTTMLGYLCDDNAVGYYTNSIKLVKVLISVITAIGGVLLPRLTYYYNRRELDKCSEIVNKVFRVMLYLFAPCAVGIILTSDCIVPILYGESFMPAITTLRIAALLILVLGFSNLFGTQVLLTFNCEKKLLLCTVCGAVSNVALNSILIPFYQQNGAAIASVVSESLVTIMSYLFARKYVTIHLKKREILAIIGGLGFMSALLVAFRSLINNIWLELVGSILIGILSYCSVSILINRNILEDIKLKD